MGRITPNVAPDPWATTEQGWKDLITPAPAAPLMAALPTESTRNPELPTGIVTWQEPRPAGLQMREEPSWTRSDHRLWITAGSLMALATGVLALLGMLSFSGQKPAAPAAALISSSNEHAALVTPPATKDTRPELKQAATAATRAAAAPAAPATTRSVASAPRANTAPATAKIIARAAAAPKHAKRDKADRADGKKHRKRVAAR
jgi:hypothetical protein